LTEGNALHGKVSRSLADRLAVLALARARLEPRRRPIGLPRQIVQPATDQPSQPPPVRRQGLAVAGAAVEPEHAPERGGGGIKIEPARCRRWRSCARRLAWRDAHGL